MTENDKESNDKFTIVMEFAKERHINFRVDERRKVSIKSSFQPLIPHYVCASKQRYLLTLQKSNN